jgi:hypothetical protein
MWETGRMDNSRNKNDKFNLQNRYFLVHKLIACELVTFRNTTSSVKKTNGDLHVSHNNMHFVYFCILVGYTEQNYSAHS